MFVRDAKEAATCKCCEIAAKNESANWNTNSKDLIMIYTHSTGDSPPKTGANASTISCSMDFSVVAGNVF